MKSRSKIQNVTQHAFISLLKPDPCCIHYTNMICPRNKYGLLTHKYDLLTHKYVFRIKSWSKIQNVTQLSSTCLSSLLKPDPRCIFLPQPGCSIHFTSSSYAKHKYNFQTNKYNLSSTDKYEFPAMQSGFLVLASSFNCWIKW